MKKFQLLDLDHDVQTIKQNQLYETASHIALKYGSYNKMLIHCNYDQIREFWKYGDPYPSIDYFNRKIKVPSIKWYIHNKISVDYPIWNSDFLHGLMSHGRIIWNSNRFPTFEWFNNDTIEGLLKNCPFGGGISETKCNTSIRNKWTEVPALYLKHSTDSLSFMAGVMAGVQVFKKDNINYGIFNKRALPYFMAWGIPIEEELQKFKYSPQIMYLVSPIWPALFIKYMPSELSDTWLHLKKPCNASLYAAILWKVYMNNSFPVNGIPYLKSRRMIYYKFECEEGAMKKLNQLWMEKNLTTLDNKIKNVVKEWGKNE